MSFMDDDIREIAVSIWETLFTHPLTAAAQTEPMSAPAVTGCVHIEGEWNGAVMLQCDSVLAATLAGELFQSSTPSSDEVRDTVGELTNMLAGNIKALLTEPSRISLPTVALGEDYALTVVGTTAISTVALRCDDAPLLVTLLQRQPDGDS